MSTIAVISARTNDVTSHGARSAYSPSLDRVVLVGFGTASVVTSDDHGVTWADRTAPLVDGVDVVWSPDLAKFVAIGDAGTVTTSSNGITWSPLIVVGAYFFPAAIAWSSAQSQFVMVGTGYSSYYSLPNNSVWTSPDATVWTGQGNPFTNAEGVAWSPTLSLWAVTTLDGHIWTSPNGAAWTDRGNILDTGRGMRWLPNSAAFVAVGGAYGAVAASSNGTAWALTPGQPLGSLGTAYDVAEAGTAWLVGGNSLGGSSLLFASDDQGSTWHACYTSNDGHATEIRGLLSIGTSTLIAGANPPGTIMSGPVVSSPSPPAVRFYQGYDWRWIVTDLAGATITFLDPLAMNRQITYTLNDAAVATCDLPADNPEINISQGGEPFVSFANKLLYAFRREQPGTSQPWVCRFAGVIEELNDEITPQVDAPVTHLTAYDPWHYLDSMPVINNAVNLGQLPGQGGVTFPANGDWTPAKIVVTLIQDGVLHNVLEGGAMPFAPQYCYIDTQSGHVPPNVPDPTSPIIESVNFQQGMSIGDALRQMTTDGLCDIIFTPIYPMVTTGPHDPSYGALCKLNIYALAGSDQNAAIFAWDKPSNSLNGLNRLENASTMGNHAMLAAGSAGIPTVASPNAQSTQKYGPYWYIDSVTGKLAYPGVVQVLAQAQVLQRAYGQPTLAIDPAPELSPIPFLDYNLGDNVPVYASSRFREPIAPVLNEFGTAWDGLGRVWSIPITMPDDAPETVTQMVVQIFPVQPRVVPEETRIMVAIAANLARARRISAQQRAARRLQVFYGHLSGYGYGT